MTIKELIKVASNARAMSDTRYSNFKVGAALLTKTGKVYSGCNIEHASYHTTMCAERTAVFKAVSKGEKDFDTLVVIGGPASEKEITSRYITPCGTCRQVLAEFNNGDLKIICANSEDDYIESSLSEMLPLMFTSENL